MEIEKESSGTTIEQRNLSYSQEVTTMKKLPYIPLLAFSFLLVFLLNVSGQDVTTGENEMNKVSNPAKEACEKLEDFNRNVRWKAEWQLITARQVLSTTLLRRLAELSKKPDNSYECSLHLVVQVLGIWRIEDAVQPLVDMIDFEIDRSTVPSGARIHPSAYFPAAYALAQIGGKYVGKSIIRRLRSEGNPKTVLICVWTLLKSYGEDITTFLLEKEELSTKDEVVKQRMKKAKELVAQGDRLLFFDEKPQGADKEATPTPPASDKSAPSSPASISSRPTGASGVVPSATDTAQPSGTPNATGTGTSSEGGAEGAVAEATPFPWVIVIVVVAAALALGAITTFLITRRKKA